MGMIRPRADNRPAPLSPARQALAAAIVARDEEHARRAAMAAAAADAAQLRWDLKKRVDDLRARLEELRAAVASEAVQTALEGRKPEAVSLRDARLDLADAEDAFEIATATRDRLKEETERQGVSVSDFRVRQAAQAVLAEEAREHALKTGKDAMRLHRELELKAIEFGWLVENKVIPVGAPGHRYGEPLDDELRHFLLAMRHLPQTGNQTNRSFVPPDAAAAWKVALAELERDATAPLPIGGV